MKFDITFSIPLLSVYFPLVNAIGRTNDERDMGSRSLLPDLQIIPSSNIPQLLQLCQGDCDFDSDCADNLICFHRDDRAIHVPGCGSTDNINDNTIDFCVDPNTLIITNSIPITEFSVVSSSVVATSNVASNGTIVDLIVPQNVPFPENSPRLQKCQGDCDEDVDCTGILLCYQRIRNEPVPGCSGYESYPGVDFCYDPNDDPKASADAQDPYVKELKCLYQDDFANGTLIINVSGVYGLCEDISFCPNAPVVSSDGTLPDDAFDPIFPSAIYDEHAFALGFFAAISICTDNVTILLNGYTFDQCEAHALMQRFFSIIELAAEPFIGGAGPHMFVGPNETFTCGNNIAILGPGVMGRSSHHAIHGNGNKNVTVRDILFRDFEVAAVAINKVDGLQIINCVVDGNRQDVPVVGLFSAARFIRPYMKYLKEHSYSMSLRNQVVSASTVYDKLIASINNVYKDVMSIKQIDAIAHPDEYRLFNNPHRVIDGPCYVFLVHGRGPAINGFGDWYPDNVTLTSSNITIRNNTIRNIVCYNREIPAAVINGTVQIDARGSVFQFVDTVANTGIALNLTDGTYVGDIVADAQIMVAKAIRDGIFNATVGNALLLTNVNKISPQLVTWAEGIPTGTPPVTPTFDPAYRCNGDSMHHVAKGINVIRIDDTAGYEISHNTIEDVINLSSPPFNNCTDYHLLTDIENVNQTQIATIRGIVVSATRAWSDGTPSIVEQNVLTGFYSLHGKEVIGIDVQGDTNALCIVENTVDLNVNAGINTTDPYFSLIVGPYADGNGTTTTLVIKGNTFSEEQLIENNVTYRRQLRSYHKRSTRAGSIEWEVYRGRRVLTEVELRNAGGCPFAFGKHY